VFVWICVIKVSLILFWVKYVFSPHIFYLVSLTVLLVLIFANVGVFE